MESVAMSPPHLAASFNNTKQFNRDNLLTMAAKANHLTNELMSRRNAGLNIQTDHSTSNT